MDEQQQAENLNVVQALKYLAFYKVYDHVQMVPLPNEVRGFLTNLVDGKAWDKRANERYVALYSQEYAMERLAKRIYEGICADECASYEETIKASCKTYALREEMKKAFPWKDPKLFPDLSEDTTALIKAHTAARTELGWETPGHVLSEEERRNKLERIQADFEKAADDAESFQKKYGASLNQWAQDFLTGIIAIGRNRSQALETALKQPEAEAPRLCPYDVNEKPCVLNELGHAAALKQRAHSRARERVVS